MGKTGLASSVASPRLKVLWTVPWCPVSVTSFGLKEARKPIAFLLLLWLCVYFLLELYLFLLVDNAPPGVYLPITSNTSDSPCDASPYCVVNSKALFQGPMDFYVHKPLSVILNRALRLDLLMSANFVSFMHILFAMIGAKLISNDSLSVRRFGVLVYEFRNFLDSLDGVIAKEEHKGLKDMHIINEPTSTWGYFIDGFCDGLGCMFLLIGCLFYMQRHLFQRKLQQVVYVPLSVVSITNSNIGASDSSMSSSTSCHKKKPKQDDDDDDDDSDVQQGIGQSGYWYSIELYISSISLWFHKNISNLRIALTGAGLPATLYLCQLFFSSLFWNRNILLYGKLLEPNVQPVPFKKIEEGLVASEAIHSPFMWLVIFAWRICNTLNMSEVLLLAIFLDRMQEFLYLLQYSGFLIISCVAAISEIHRSDMARLVNKTH